ncbi:MAG: hypothetical protein WBB37_09325 [bacterium]
MKKTFQMKKLEEMLHSSKFSAGGFIGTDKRSLYEIIDTDAADIAKLEHTKEDISTRMTQLSELAETGLGSWVKVDENLRVRISDTRGQIPCPWAHGFRCSKAITAVERLDTNTRIQWSYMNIHLIKEHGFFEGKDAEFRLEPGELIEILF